MMMKKMGVLAVMAVMMLAVFVSQQADAAPAISCSTALKFNTCKLNRQSKIAAYNFKRSNGDKQGASALSASPPKCIVFRCRPNSAVHIRSCFGTAER